MSRTTRNTFVALLAFAGLTACKANAQTPDTSKPSVQYAKATSSKVREAGGEVAKSPAFLRIFHVYDSETQEPIADANIVDLITRNSIKSSVTGDFALVPEFVKASGALIKIQKIGYEPVGPVPFDPTVDTTVYVAMVRVGSVTLPTVVTTGVKLSHKMQTFTEHAQSQIGTFIGPDEFEKRWWGRHLPLSELLKAYPTFTASAHERGTKGCRQNTYVDGILNAPASTDGDDYQAMEFYHSPETFPAGYTVGTMAKGAQVCTLLFLWTRDASR